MLRYSMSFYDPVGIERDDDGEYVLYEQHCDEIKRIRSEAFRDAADLACSFAWAWLDGCQLSELHAAILTGGGEGMNIAAHDAKIRAEAFRDAAQYALVFHNKHDGMTDLTHDQYGVALVDYVIGKANL
jgi:hypothetical protein